MTVMSQSPAKPVRSTWRVPAPVVLMVWNVVLMPSKAGSAQLFVPRLLADERQRDRRVLHRPLDDDRLRLGLGLRRGGDGGSEGAGRDDERESRRERLANGHGDYLRDDCWVIECRRSSTSRVQHLLAARGSIGAATRTTGVSPRW
jgi:hypothetical protein